MRRMIPIRKLFGVGALASANTNAKTYDRVTSVPLQSERLSRRWASGDHSTFLSAPHRAFKLTRFICTSTCLQADKRRSCFWACELFVSSNSCPQVYFDEAR
jgi:hypothetical protein